jgi:hypothetical protein
MYSYWNDEVAAKDVAMEANYITRGIIIIAQNVTRYDDEDNLVIKHNIVLLLTGAALQGCSNRN